MKGEAGADKIVHWVVRGYLNGWGNKEFGREITLKFFSEISKIPICHCSLVRFKLLDSAGTI